MEKRICLNLNKFLINVNRQHLSRDVNKKKRTGIKPGRVLTRIQGITRIRGRSKTVRSRY
ncbi:hypothetical protein BMS3Bbin14_01648 [bacterium BMS3Bbin14]|nr:hypothetical protein BMS3Abin13_01603 [bacterium BMS3Abin13]GBE53164.1 hypothetical protein BMS3Bbin14_01648 [bacterium BMS3Bbin14]